jgi:hypothetical protein
VKYKERAHFLLCDVIAGSDCLDVCGAGASAGRQSSHRVSSELDFQEEGLQNSLPSLSKIAPAISLIRTRFQGI